MCLFRYDGVGRYENQEGCAVEDTCFYGSGNLDFRNKGRQRSMEFRLGECVYKPDARSVSFVSRTDIRLGGRPGGRTDCDGNGGISGIIRSVGCTAVFLSSDYSGSRISGDFQEEEQDISHTFCPFFTDRNCGVSHMGTGRRFGTKRIQGSYTVEAALISGVMLLTVFAVLLLAVGINKRLYDTAKSCEAAAAGSTESVRESGDGLSKAKAVLSQEAGHYSVTGSKREVVVNFEDNIHFPFGNLKWHIQGNVKAKVIRPVLFMEKVRKAKAWKEQLKQ